MTILFISTFLILSILRIKQTTQFSEDTVKFRISEDAPISTIIGKLDPLVGYTYRLSRGNSKIKFDDQTLEFSISSQLDRESEDVIDMLIITSPPAIIHVLVDILDVNDNAPKFQLDVQKISIPETAPIGFRTQILGATDPDQSANGTIGKYELVETLSPTPDTPPPFRVIQSDGFVYLEVIGKLDREERELYAMRLTATDEGTPELSSSSLLNIIILDINDNPPDFGIRSTTVTWNGLPYSSELFHLNATDADSGENGQLTYRILPGPNSDYFRITDQNILVTQNNTQCSPRCEFSIEARDSGIPSLATVLNMIVMVEYGNEHEPNINIRFYPSDYPFIVVQPEDVNGKTLAILSITDPDGPLGPNSTIWIENGNEKSIFSLISRQSINILTLKHLEMAEKEQYTLEFMANDGQGPVEKRTKKELKIYFKNNSKSIDIHVEKEYRVTVDRDTVPGSFVAHIRTNCSEMCTFELMNSDVFRIDSMNGIIVTSTLLPDDVTSYHLPIRIHPPPPSTQILETDVFVKIHQESIPKNLIRSSPDDVIHLKKAYSFSTWQNVTVGTVVGKLPRGQVYSTVDTVSELGIFPDGSIFVGKSIMKDLVTLPVILESRNTTQTSLITVLIKPLNLHSPICHPLLQIHVTEATPPGATIGRLHASDEDSGSNGVLSYRILTNPDLFHVDVSTGKLRILKELDAEKHSNLTIQYEVKDYGIPPKSTNCSASVILEDVNDNAPEFSSKFYTAKISGRINETVAIIHAEDKDISPKNSKLQYHLLNFLQYFHVDSDSGKVTTIQNLPKTFGRINVSLEAVNMDSDNFLATRTFLLVTVAGSSEDVKLNSDDVIGIYKNDVIGSRIHKLDVTSSDTILWRTEDPRFHVDASGNVILIQKTLTSEKFHVILNSESGIPLENLEFHVEFVDSERKEDVEPVEEIILKDNSTVILDLSENWKNWEIGRMVMENSENSDDVTKFFIQNRILYRGENVTDEAFVVLESKDDGSPTYKILHLSTAPPPNMTSSECPSTTHLIIPPATVPLPCQNASLKDPKLQIHADTLLIPTQSELISHVDLYSKKPFLMTLILDKNSEDVKFSTSNILMLLSSVHPIGASFGRVTAESGYRIRYFLVGTDKISIDSDTGELFLRERFFKNLNDVTIVAVIPKGIAKAKISIEVIEDRLVLSQSNFFIVSSPSTVIPIGSISLDRDDVIVDVINDHFYVRDTVIHAKKHFVPVEPFYELNGTVRKGKLSTPIRITVFFGSTVDRRNLKEHEVMYQVEENSPVGTVVGTVPNSPHSKYRLIDPACGLLIDSEGVIRTTKIFDRELTSLLKTKMIEPTENQIWDLLIFIEDVNDNPPKILNAPGSIIVSEDLDYKLHWQDSDDVASDVFFEVVDGDVFGNLEVSGSGRIQMTSMPSESFNATIRIYDNRPPFKMYSDDVTIEFKVDSKEDVGCLDSEFFVTKNSGAIMMMTSSKDSKVTWRILPTVGKFQIDPMTGEIQKTSRLQTGDVINLRIQVISYDAEKTGYCNAKIHVLEGDSESEDVKFKNSTFEFWIPETTDRFTEVGKIEFSTSPESRDVFRILNDFNFTISPFDGTISTNAPLDYESIKKFEFDVAYSTSRCHVIIHVIDENDEIPRFITGDVVNLSVLEEDHTVPYPLIIGSSIAEDLDEGQNGVVTYSILSGNTSLFAVNSTTGDIISLAPLDREESSLYELLIEAKDAGIPSLSATSRIVVHVEDVNDNIPQFDLPSYFVKIQENLKIGTRILKIHAEDRDEGSRLLYFLEDSPAPFRIDMTSGWITVGGNIDREETHGFWITVTVTDGERNSSVVVEIEVEDVNDNSPTILNQNLDVYIPEDVTPPDTVIHVVDAQDLDKNDHLKFSINDTNFIISEFGEILTTSESTYPSSIRVTVTDDVGHVTSSEYRFYVHPKKMFPVYMEKMNSVTVREHEEQELAVFKAKGQGVRYSIVSRCREHLEMEGVTGILKAKSTLDREQFSECPVFVIATSFIDNKPLSTITRIQIKILDINDNNPRFDHQIYHFNVTENSGATLIGHVIARDADSNSRIFYEIVSGDPDHEFMITENGQIESIRDLDRESRSEYHLILEAFDDGKPRRRGNTTVVVKVLDEDDNAPRFSRIFHVEIPEDVKIGESVILLSASDSDEKSMHKFEFENNGEEIPFRIQEETGMVFVNDTLDFEKKSAYRIKVRLTDGAWLIETSLFVNVKDVNDNSPIFDQPEYVFVSKKNSTIGRLHATDLDSRNNGKIQYSMTSPYFRIHPDSGVLTRLRPLPDDVMILEVVAMDHGIPRLQNTVKVYVVDSGNLKIRKIRKTSKSGDVVGRNVSSEATVIPKNMATVTRDGDIFMKKDVTSEGFWILEDSRMTSFEVVDVEDSDSEDVKNLTSSESVIQIPGCVEFLDPLIHGIHVSRNGTIRISKTTVTQFHVSCHDDIWPIHLKTIDVKIQNPPNPDDVIRIPKKSSRISRRIPKTLEIVTSSESPSGTILWEMDAPISMEYSNLVNSTRRRLILKETLTSSKMNFEIFSGNDFRRSTVTIIPDKDTPPCPIFSEDFYFFEKPSEFFLGNSEFQNFGWSPESLKTCRLEVEKNPLFHVNGSSLMTLKPLNPGSYQFSLLAKSNQSIRSKCHVVLTVTRDTVVQELPTVIFTSPNYSNPLLNLSKDYKLQNNPKFIVTDSGDVRRRGNLVEGQIYHLEVENSKQKTSESIRILLDDVTPDSDVIKYHVIGAKDSGCLKTSNKTKCDVIYENYSTPDDAFTIDVICSKNSISHLIRDLRQHYSDMEIHILSGFESSEDVKYQMTLALVDRNGITVQSSEAQKTLTSFFKKQRLQYVDFLGFRRDPCEGVTCLNSTCKRILDSEATSRMTSRNMDTVFEIPQKTLIGKCFCKDGKECSGKSEDVKLLDDVITIQKTCSDMDCGPNGQCFMDTVPICRCSEGFESFYNCQKASEVFSTSSGGHLEISMKNSSSNEILKCGNSGCEGVQKMEVDFRTILERSELLRVEFGKQKALVELISGSIHFSISDEFTRPIQTQIEKRLNDGRWHRLLLQMSDDGRRISIQIDGRGKEVKSRVPLPMLFSSKKILLMTSSEFCFRRLLIQNQFVHPKFSMNKFFDVTSTSTVTRICSFDQIPSKSFLSNFSNTTTVILLSILALISLIGITVCILAIRRKKKTSERGNGWKKTSEINAFAIPRRPGGHVNRSMVKSPDDDIYDVATGYGTQMKSTSTDDMTHIYTSSSSRRYQPPLPPYRRDGHINMAYL